MSYLPDSFVQVGPAGDILSLAWSYLIVRWISQDGHLHGQILEIESKVKTKTISSVDIFEKTVQSPHNMSWTPER